MDSEREARKRSIRAARDWLTGAENSLAGADDVAGDLKLMLARAELACMAAQQRTRLRRWIRFFVPLLVSAAALAWVLWEPPSADPMPHAPALPERAEQPTGTNAEDTVQASSVIQAPYTGAAAPLSEPLAAPAARTAEPDIPPAADRVPTAERTPPPPPASVRQMPNSDMQRLMQVGGKILRE